MWWVTVLDAKTADMPAFLNDILQNRWLIRKVFTTLKYFEQTQSFLCTIHPLSPIICGSARNNDRKIVRIFNRVIVLFMIINS